MSEHRPCEIFRQLRYFHHIFTVIPINKYDFDTCVYWRSMCVCYCDCVSLFLLMFFYWIQPIYNLLFLEAMSKCFEGVVHLGRSHSPMALRQNIYWMKQCLGFVSHGCMKEICWPPPLQSSSVNGLGSHFSDEGFLVFCWPLMVMFWESVDFRVDEWDVQVIVQRTVRNEPRCVGNRS
jgi:hypothetical protein